MGCIGHTHCARLVSVALALWRQDTEVGPKLRARCERANNANYKQLGMGSFELSAAQLEDEWQDTLHHARTNGVRRRWPPPPP